MIDALLDALERQHDVVAMIDASTLARPSACAGWSIGDVLAHSVGVTRKLSAFAAGATDEPHTPSGDLLGSDHRVAVRAAVDEARAAWRDCDPTRMCRLPFGTFTVDATAGINLFDVLAHTWDVASPLGIALAHPDALWAAGLDAARHVIEPERDARHYGEAVPCATDAPAMTRFLAYLGRRG